MSENGSYWGNILQIFHSCPEFRFMFSRKLAVEIGRVEVKFRKIQDGALAKRAEMRDRN